MPQIGSVEFLVKFDTIGRTFQDALEKAMKKADVGAPKGIIPELKQIKNYMKILKTPFSGQYDVDVIKARPYIKQLGEEKYRKEIINTFANTETLLKYIKGDKDIEVGSEAAKKIAEETVPNIMNQLLKFMQTTLSSPQTYAEKGSKMRTLIKFFEMGTETGFRNIMKNLMKQITVEFKVDKKVAKRLLEEVFGEEEVKGFTKAGVTPEKAWYHRTTKAIDVGGEEKISSFLDLLKAMKDWKIETIRELFTSPTTVFKKGTDLGKRIEELVEKYRIEAGTFMPRSLSTTIEEWYEDVGNTLDDYIIPDVRAVSEHKEAIIKQLEKKEDLLSPEEFEKMKNDVSQFMDEVGFFVLFWENASFGTIKKWREDIGKYPKNMRKFLMGEAPWGAGGAVTDAQLAAVKQTAKEMVDAYEKDLPNKVLSSVADLFKRLGQNIMASNEEQKQAIMDTIKQQFDNFPEELKELISAVWGE